MPVDPWTAVDCRDSANRFALWSKWVSESVPHISNYLPGIAKRKTLHGRPDDSDGAATASECEASSQLGA